MTRIFFYHHAADRVATAAGLIAKAVVQRKRLLVFAPDPELAMGLDRQLWVDPPTGFIPHVFADSPLAGETPVVITRQLESLSHDERLVNLATDVPAGFSRFTSVVEVVGRSEEERLAGRRRAKFYRDRGYEITFVDLSETR